MAVLGNGVSVSSGCVARTLAKFSMGFYNPEEMEAPNFANIRLLGTENPFAASSHPASEIPKEN